MASEEQLDITIAIPTYNRANYLSQILKALCSQIKVSNLNWEIIIIDNNSTDNTDEVIHNYQASWQGNCTLRYFLEKKQGAAFARLRAVREAKSQLIGFLDDDNLPAPDWVKEAVDFAKEHPKAGAWSGQIHGDFEVKPPKDFERIQAFLAIREHGEQPLLFEPESLRLPPAAALVVRKKAWLENVSQKPKLSGKLPGLLVQGDDYEPLLYIHNGGWEIWYNPAMHTYHQIPHWRLEKDYLMSLARGCGLCICQLRLLNAKNWQKPIVFFRTIFGNFFRIIRHLIKFQFRFGNNIVARFELEFYLGSMNSPFYWMRCYLSQFISNSVNLDKN